MDTIKLKTFTTVSKCSKYLVGYTWKHVGVVKPKIMLHHTGVTSSSLYEATNSHAEHELFEEGFNLLKNVSVPAFYLAIYSSNRYV